LEPGGVIGFNFESSIVDFVNAVVGMAGIAMAMVAPVSRKVRLPC